MSGAQGLALIVGGTGQVGGALREAWPGAAVATSRQPDQGKALTLDALTPEGAARLLDEVRPQVLFLAAAFTNVEACEDQPDLAHHVNAGAPGWLATAARRVGARTVHFSTDYVFDGAGGPYAEDDPTSPLSVYGRTKRAGEQAVLASDPEALVLRTTVVYGPEARGRNFAYRLAQTIGEGGTLRAPVDQISTPTYNRDLAAAAVALVDAGVAGIVHVAGAELADRVGFARRLARAAGLPERIEAVATASLGQRAPRPLAAGLRIERLRALVPGLRLRTVEEAVADWRRHPRGRRWPELA